MVRDGFSFEFFLLGDSFLFYSKELFRSALRLSSLLSFLKRGGRWEVGKVLVSKGLCFSLLQGTFSQ